MENQKNIETNASRPMDESLEAYMAWIMGLHVAQGNTEMIFTKAEWAAAWKEYWDEGFNYLIGDY